MQRLIWLTIIVFFGLRLSSLHGQEKPSRKGDVETEAFRGSTAILLADSLQKVGKIIEARAIYSDILPQFKKEKNWNAYVEASIAFANTFQGDHAYQTGIAALERAIQLVTTKGDQYHASQSSLHFHLGMLYYSVQEGEPAVSEWKKQLQILNTLFEPYSSWEFVTVYIRMVFTFIELGDLDGAWRKLVIGLLGENVPFRVVYP